MSKNIMSIWKDELEKIKVGISDEELVRAKEFVAGKMALDLEDSMSIAQYYGNLALAEKPLIAPAEKLKKIMTVKKEEIIRVAEDIFNLKVANLAVIGPFKDEKRFLKLLK